MNNSDLELKAINAIFNKKSAEKPSPKAPTAEVAIAFESSEALERFTGYINEPFLFYEHGVESIERVVLVEYEQSENPMTSFSFDSNAAVEQFMLYMNENFGSSAKLTSNILLLNFGQKENHATSFYQRLGDLINFFETEQEKNILPVEKWKSDIKPFDIIDFNLSKNGDYDKFLSKIEGKKEQHSKAKNEDQAAISFGNSYTSEQWKKKLAFIIEHNFSLEDSITPENIVDAVIESGKENIHTPCLGNVFLMNSVCKAFQNFAVERICDRNCKHSAYANGALLHLNKVEELNKDADYQRKANPLTETLGGDNLWDSMVKQISSKLGKPLLTVVPNDYEEALKAYFNDENHKSQTFVGKLDFMLYDDILSNPAAALKTSNLIYSKQEQGISIERSIIGFLVRDMMTVISVIFSAKMINYIDLLTRDEDRLKSIDADTFWEIAFSECMESTRKQFFCL